MALFQDREHELAQAVTRLSYINPFLPERIEEERRALGDEFVATDHVWHARPGEGLSSTNVPLLATRAGELLERIRARLAAGTRGSEQELSLYEDLLVFTLYHDFEDDLWATIESRLAGGGGQRIPYYQRFRDRLEHFTALPGLRLLPEEETPHLFAMFFHLRRAFSQIFSHLVGASMAMTRLRAAVWQSIFTHDMRRYRRVLFDRMDDVTTLVTGPSGTGKELVARAIGLSRYIPFDEEREQFTEEFHESFHPLNLSALSSTLIESELFGHRRGSFTGALDDHAGWFEVCGKLGTVFLDEIGELDPSIQVKLLRVLQTRTFQRLGDTRTRPFQGKVIAATNRDLGEEMQEGRFRQDLYYRLCSDIVVTPSLAEQLADDPAEIHDLVLFIARRLLADEGDRLAEEVERWIEGHLGHEYAWPGNFRELEQCVRNVLVRGEYHPEPLRERTPGERLLAGIRDNSLTAEQLLCHYCTLSYASTGNYEETARRLALDRRTVKAKIDPELLEQYRRDPL